MDSLTPAERSERMARVKNKNTKPELAVRRMVHAMGYRYRLHVSGLPGKPDLVFSALRKVIFVHGCFWHRHGTRCPLTRLPKSKLEFWKPKLDKNRERDQANQRRLRRAGWRVLVVWECQLSAGAKLRQRIAAFLSRGTDPVTSGSTSSAPSPR